MLLLHFIHSKSICIPFVGFNENPGQHHIGDYIFWGKIDIMRFEKISKYRRKDILILNQHGSQHLVLALFTQTFVFSLQIAN